MSRDSARQTASAGAKPETPKPQGLRFSARMVTHLLRAFLRLLVILRIFRVHVVNRPTFDGPLIIVANHTNDLFDPSPIGGAMRRPVIFVSKAEVWKWPIVGWLMRVLGEIPVDRDDPASRASVVPISSDVLRHGGAVIVFPEGTTHRKLTYKPGTPAHGPLFDGVAKMAYETGAKIQVIGMRGVNDVFTVRGKKIAINRKGRIVVNCADQLIDPWKCREDIAANPQAPTSTEKKEIIAAIMRDVETLLTAQVMNAYSDAGIEAPAA